MNFDWTDFEETLYAALHSALLAFGARLPSARIYAIALHGVYRELDRALTLPILAVAVEERSSDERGDFWGVRYNPADFSHPEVFEDDTPGRSLEQALTVEATRGSHDHFFAVSARYTETLVHIAARLRDAAPDVICVTEDFISYVFDSAEGHLLAERTIAVPLFAQLFPKQLEYDAALQAMAKLPPRERAAYCVTRFSIYEGITSEDAQRALLAIGPDALDALEATLSHPENSWVAAKLIGQIGVSRPSTIDALRRGADHPWFATALGMLGDNAWLAKQEQNIAISGLTAPLLAFTGHDDTPALDYAPLIAYLNAAPDSARAGVEEQLAPGRSYVTCTTTDVDEALRGLQSTEPAIRWHAASLVGDRGLGPSVGERVLPMLTTLLKDPHPIVRRLAVLAIDRWKQQADPFRDAIRLLVDDPDETVRNIVAHLLNRA